MKCPNCNGEIGRFELAPNCKHCGVNIFYSQQEKLLTEDAKKCELEFASFRILTAKLKGAFIGGPLQIMRIIAMVAAIGIIFIPFATFTAELPLFEAKFSLGAFGVYQAFTGGELEALLSMNTYLPEIFTAILVLCALFVFVFLMGLGIFIALLLSFLNIQKSAKKMCVISVFGFIFSLIAAVMSFILPQITSGTFIQTKAGIGAFFCAAIFVILFVLNRLIIKKNIKADIKQVDLLRVETEKKVKSGEISLDDLPLPVFEDDGDTAVKLKGGDRNG